MAVKIEVFTPTRTYSSGTYTGWSYSRSTIHHSDTKNTVVFNAKCTVIDSQPGQMTFTVLPDNPLYDELYIRRTEVLLWINDTPIWCGYISKIEDDFYRQRKVTCTGCLAYLQDSILPTNEYRALSNVPAVVLFSLLFGSQNSTPGQSTYSGQGWVKQHNSFMGDCLWKKFTEPDISEYYKWCVTGTTGFKIVDLYTSDYVTPWQMISKQVIEGSTAHILPVLSAEPQTSMVTKAIKMYSDDAALIAASQNTKIISFGKNLVDCAKTISAEKAYSLIYPVGAEVEGDFAEIKNRVTIASVNSGSQIIENDDSVTSYGRIYSVKKYNDFKNILQADSFKSSGLIELLGSRHTIDSLTVTAIDLYNLTNDSSVTQVGDALRIVSEVHGIDSTLLCTKAEYDIDNPQNSKIFFGQQKKKLSIILKGD